MRDGAYGFHGEIEGMAEMDGMGEMSGMGEIVGIEVMSRVVGMEVKGS